jgi:3-oxoacyl-[acyl-carrier-protein] synthase II
MRVVVTGVGLAVPGCVTVQDLLGGVVVPGGFDPAKALLGRDLRHKDRASRLAIRAVEPALKDAGLFADGFTGQPDRTAVVVASILGILDDVCHGADVIAEKTVAGMSAVTLPQTSINVIAGSVAIRHGMRGPNVTLANGATSGLDAVHFARNLIAAGRADTAVVVGAEPAGEAVSKLLGANAADAAVAIVVESAASAAARGVRPRAGIAEYRRARDLGAAIGGLAAQSFDIWLQPEGECDARVDAPRRLGLDWLGRTCGALGVLQCAAAVAHFDTACAGSSPGPVLATAGGAVGDEAAAALVLSCDREEDYGE